MLDNKIIAERLKACREAWGEKQTDIANLLNAQRQIVSYYETGKRMPNIEDLALLAKHFNTSVDYLLGLSDIKSTDTELTAVCNYTGLSEYAIKRLNNLNDETINGSAAFKYYPQLNDEHKKRAVLELELIDFFLRSDGTAFSCMLDSGIKYKEQLKEWIDKANNFFDSVGNLNSVDEETAEKLWDIRCKLINEEYNAVKCNYYDAVEIFKESLDEYIEDLTKTIEDLSDRLMRFHILKLLEKGETNGEHN